MVSLSLAFSSDFACPVEGPEVANNDEVEEEHPNEETAVVGIFLLALVGKAANDEHDQGPKEYCDKDHEASATAAKVVREGLLVKLSACVASIGNIIEVKVSAHLF